MALYATLYFWHCVAHRAEQSSKFRRSGSPTPRDNRDFRLLLWGNGAKYGAS
ncbi:hypothetical protein DPMN_092439 [Dreissena polymorpha]|uniref:Uncharacterized protein n=1 Tax=Dreissena polymorpha TaxID=45954 RepID=A0A9D4R061_DREPO|nr:hypothetical protein DPMN_092439 [Dreissena polymorpha]